MKDSVSSHAILTTSLFFSVLTWIANAAADSSLPPNLSGLTLFLVSDVSQHDARPVDGNNIELVQGVAERSTGCTFKEFSIVIDFGGLRPSGSPAPVRTGPPPGFFKKGQTYWIETTSRPEYGACHPELIGWWNSDDPHTNSLKSALDSDLLRRRPHYSSSGFKVNYFEASESGYVTVEVLKTDTFKWAKEFNGKPASYLALLFGEANLGGGFTPEQARINPKVPVVTVSTDEELSENNLYGVKPGLTSIRRAFDAETGKPLAEFIHDKYLAIFDSKTSKMVVSEKWRWNPDAPSPTLNLPRGRLEKTVEQFDPDSGKLKSTKKFINGKHGWEAT